MRQSILLDTGPLVAALNRGDRYHEWALSHLNTIQPPLLTCESVLSEACFLLGRTGSGGEPVMQLVQRGVIEVSFVLGDHVSPVAGLLRKYRSVPMSLADACLVRMSELHTDACVFTLDSDFRLYRRSGRQVVPTLMPDV